MRNRLLVRHFLNRFLDNDLISPHAARQQVISVACGAVATMTLFITILIAFKYQAPFVPPGVAAVSSLDDKFLYFACSIIFTSLLAVAEWNALSLDARDTLI